MAESKPQGYQQGYHTVVTSSHASRTAEAEGAFVIPHLQPHFRILDIGRGPGTISCGFAKYVPNGNVTAIDLTPEIIKQAQERLTRDNSSHKPKNVTFALGNVLEGLSFESDAFDVVFCSQTLIHIHDPVKALTEMKRVCKPGGFVACREADFPFRRVPNPPGLQLLQKYNYMTIVGNVPSDSQQPDNPPFAPGHRGGSLVHVWAREAGFDPLKIEKSARVSICASPEQRAAQLANTVARVEQAGYRQKFMALGASEADVDSMLSDSKAWAEDVDGWQAIMQCETIAWA